MPPGRIDTDNQIPLIIVTKPGLLRNSLLAFLRAMPRVQVIASVDDPADALQLAHEHHPSVVIVDTDLSEDGAFELIRRLRDEQPALICITLANDVHQQQLSLAAGANVALLKGFLDERLREAVLGELDSSIFKTGKEGLYGRLLTSQRNIHRAR